MKHLKTFEKFFDKPSSFEYDEHYLLKKMSKGQFKIDKVEDDKIYFIIRDKGKWTVKMPDIHTIEVSFVLRKDENDYYLREINKVAERKIDSDVGMRLWYYLHLKIKKTGFGII